MHRDVYERFVSGALVAVFFLLCRWLGSSRRAALVASGLLASSTYVAAHSVFFLRHTTVAVLVLGALLAFVRHRQDGGLVTLALFFGPGISVGGRIQSLQILAMIFGLQFAVLGLLGEFIVRIYHAQTQPFYVVRDGPEA